MPNITIVDARPLSATPISSPEVDFGDRGNRNDHGVDAITSALSDDRGGARIRIAEHTRPFRHARSEEIGGIHGNDGIYSMRAITRTATGQRSLSRSRTRTSEKDVEDDDPGLRQQSDYKQKQVCLVNVPIPPAKTNMSHRSSTERLCYGLHINQLV